MTTSRVDGVLFDKDGTLFDFSATWDVWARHVLEDLAEGQASRLGELAGAVRFDLSTGTFLPDSPVIAGTNRQAAECLVPYLPGWDIDGLDRYLSVTSAQAPLAPAVPLAPLLDRLADMGLRLGVMTNDTEHGAVSHLEAAGVGARFDFIAGADSGFGAKPDPAPLLAFADRFDLAPERVVMVGDSTHDLMAGRAAGMQTVGVLTGPANAASLLRYADAVLPDIGHLPGWLSQL
ncbi:HAD family hydrolase [Pseudoprimorskyibacter insulae]|uniref:phosphoglycolate phosphatase n=1 Tax=Pseudoprimorskyibacter insulae TaxID=1695997 RepID=A0A2R8AQD6_9RHOB|nr:HAD family hydrolase [Pseudoprimorskyibacter insulae]SPF78087.1 Pyrophosphatase PpaX [Pseudoprimorskyibacter insulae]